MSPSYIVHNSAGNFFENEKKQEKRKTGSTLKFPSKTDKINQDLTWSDKKLIYLNDKDLIKVIDTPPLTK